jgi:hypothetical protein
VMIDGDSRLHIFRHEGVMVAFLDKRVDPTVVLLPGAHQPIEMHEAIGAFPILSEDSDDGAHTASVVISRIDNGQIVVASGPET